MPFRATVIRVLIASPSDTAAARLVVVEVMEDWNSLNAEEAGVMLLPVRWERDATPEMGDRPQAIINRQLVEAADLLIGIFWTRLGTPTSEAESGTAEEIELFIKSGKPVLLYFSSEPVVPESVDPNQYAPLTDFRKGLEGRGLVDRFASPEELRRKVTAALTRTIRERFARDGGPHEETAVDDKAGVRRQHASLLAQIQREREMRGVSKSGRPQYSTRERLIILNQGTGPAEQLTFDFELPEGVDGEPPATIGNEQPVRRLPPGGSVEYPLLSHLGSANQWDIVFRWSEDGEHFEERQTMK
jgi:hypothetical protein